MGGESVGARLARLNAWPAALARQELLACCSSARWATEVASGRPYASVDEVLARSQESVAGLTRADLQEALAGHPRIGDLAASAPVSGEPADAGWSRDEQAGVHSADRATARALAEGNAAYERRFGHIYLVCATGRSGPELLALLRERLGNDAAAEWAVVRRELAKINQIRLRKLLEGAV
jgi:2-oxo-4-hydroxy-4-carboxy-5-ureidoimidazoline decarboxylase